MSEFIPLTNSDIEKSSTSCPVGESMPMTPPIQNSNWEICLNPFGNPVTHYFKRKLPSSDPCDINQICRLCWDELLKQEGYQKIKSTAITTPFVSTRGTESKPEKDSL